jgi:hypothetical protein
LSTINNGQRRRRRCARIREDRNRSVGCRCAVQIPQKGPQLAY